MRILWTSQICLDKDNMARIEMAQALANLGHDIRMVVTLAEWGRKNELNPPSFVTFIRTSRFPLLHTITFQAQLVPYFIRLLFCDLDAVVVDDRTIWGAFVFGCLARFGLIRTKYVLDIRSIPVDLAGVSGMFRSWAFRLTMLAASYCMNGISVITSATEHELRAQYGLRHKFVGRWSSGVDTCLFNPSVKVSAQVLPAHMDGEFKIIYHGILSPNRGLQQTVKGISLARHQMGIPVALILLGDGAARKELEALIVQEQLKREVYLCPRVPHSIVPQYIAAADAGIVPLPDISWWRISSPLKLMEYLAMGKPVIVTDIEAHRSVLSDAECAIYISTNSPEDIARAIGVLYGKRDQLKELGNVGRRIVEEHYTWMVQAGRFESYLKALIMEKDEVAEY